MAADPEICEEQWHRALLFSPSTFMQISSSRIWEMKSGLLAGTWPCPSVASGTGPLNGAPLKWARRCFLKWLLALLPKIGERRADRETPGICSAFHSTLQFQTTKLSLHFCYIFYPFFFLAGVGRVSHGGGEQREVRKSQVSHLNRSKVEYLSSSWSQSWLKGKEEHSRGDIDFYFPNNVSRISALFTEIAQ